MTSWARRYHDQEFGAGFGAYDRKAAELARMFRENFEQFANASPEVAAAGPSA